MSAELLVPVSAGLAGAMMAGSAAALLWKPSSGLRVSGAKPGEPQWVELTRVSVRKLRKQITYAEALKDKLCLDLYLGGVRDLMRVKGLRMAAYFSLAAGLVFFAVSVAGSGGAAAGFQAAAPGFLGFYWVKRFARTKREERQFRMDMELPEMLDLLTVAVEAGVGLVPALQTALERLNPKSPLQQELETLVQEHVGGIPIQEACERLSQRCGVESVSILMSNIIQSQQLGTSLGDMLRVVAADLRDKQRQRMKEKAMQIPVKILMPSMLIFGPLMILLIAPSILEIMRNFSSIGK
jgi:Flp pilus assembly protein TadB